MSSTNVVAPKIVPGDDAPRGVRSVVGRREGTPQKKRRAGAKAKRVPARKRKKKRG